MSDKLKMLPLPRGDEFASGNGMLEVFAGKDTALSGFGSLRRNEPLEPSYYIEGGELMFIQPDGQKTADKAGLEPIF